MTTGLRRSERIRNRKGLTVDLDSVRRSDRLKEKNQSLYAMKTDDDIIEENIIPETKRFCTNENCTCRQR